MDHTIPSSRDSHKEAEEAVLSTEKTSSGSGTGMQGEVGSHGHSALVPLMMCYLKKAKGRGGQ